MPPSHLWSRRIWIALNWALLFDVGSDVEDFDFVDVEEVVTEVELGEPEWDVEFGVVGRIEWCVHECDRNIRTVQWLSLVYKCT